MAAKTKQVAEADDEFLREAAARIRMQMSQDIIEIGRELIAVKDRVGHGKFLHWLDTEVEISDPTATRMMNVAREYGGKSFPVKDLRRKVLYELAAPSTPPEVRDKVERRVLAGEDVTLMDVQALKQEVEERAYVVEHGVPSLVEAVDRGDVSVSAAMAFAIALQPSVQDTLIIKAGGSVAKAIEKESAEVRAEADRAAAKRKQQRQQLKLGELAQSDPTKEDRDSSDPDEHRATFDQFSVFLKVFAALEARGDAAEVAEAVLALDVGDPVPRLLRVCTFTTEVANIMNSKLKSPNAAAAGGAA
jgi:Protein of unknown function (DUF3102)